MRGGSKGQKSFYIPSGQLGPEHMLEFKGKTKEHPKDIVSPTAFAGFLPQIAPKRQGQQEPQGRTKTSLMWSKQVLDGIQFDNIELVKAGLAEQIANPNAKVTGGVMGAPFQLGDEGFFTEEQIVLFTSSLKNLARDNAEHNRMFVHALEWEANDRDFQIIGRYTPKPTFKTVVRGDTALHLALRSHSFEVASYLADGVVYNMEANDEGVRPSNIMEHNLDVLRQDLLNIREIKRKLEQARQGKAAELSTDENRLLKEETLKLKQLACVPFIAEAIIKTAQKNADAAAEAGSKIRRFKIMNLPIPPADFEKAKLMESYLQEIDLCKKLQHGAKQIIDRHPGASALPPRLTRSVQSMRSIPKSELNTLNGLKTVKVQLASQKKKGKRKGHGSRQSQLLISALDFNCMDEFDIAAHKIQAAWRKRHKK